MRYIEDQPKTETDAALITRLAAWIGSFDPAGKIFLEFEREKCQHNAELMAVLATLACSTKLLRDYSEQVARAGQMGYLSFHLDPVDGIELSDRDYILLADRRRNAPPPGC